MDADNDRHRIPWTTRINIRPISREMIRKLARDECISVATLIGHAVETYVSSRSSA